MSKNHLLGQGDYGEIMVARRPSKLQENIITKPLDVSKFKSLRKSIDLCTLC